MKKRKYDKPVKLIIFLAVILLAIFLLIGYIWELLTTSEFFGVKQVIVRNCDASLDYLKGRNIFRLDLENQSRKIFYSCPDCRRVRFSRIF